MDYEDIRSAFRNTGLSVRGGFKTGRDEDPADTTIVLIGNIGPAMWTHFAPHAKTGTNPLDEWTGRIVGPIAQKLGAIAVYPSQKPHRPFQRWAVRAEPVKPSPIGILIHAEHGLWHAYRAALFFNTPVDLPLRAEEPSPCETCVDRPCLTACPVGAFSNDGYDVPACTSHLRSEAGTACLDGGCRARAACPVAPDARYTPDQTRFHMAAFFRSRGND